MAASDSDGVVINADDISDYNPDQILPVKPQRIAEIRRWLDATSYSLESGEYRKHLSSHLAGTGSWLTHTVAYGDWVHGDHHGLLWLKEIPGSGKSVMAATLTDELMRKHPGVPVLYFFFRQIIDANHKPGAMLRDWLDQLLVYSPPLQRKLKNYVKAGQDVASLSLEDLFGWLRLGLSGLPGKAFCVVDALDEMDRGHDVFLKSLGDLGQWKPGRIKVMITSRPVPSVEIPLRNTKCLQIRLKEDMVDVDIAAFVQHQLRNSGIAETDWPQIKQAVPGLASGLFLYAKLAMDAFLKCDSDVEEVLRDLPADLNVMYTDLLREHSRRSGVPDDIQLLILQWVTHATRPLRLLEVAEMINTTYYKGRVEGGLQATKSLVRTACGPLLEVLPDETVCVIHHSFTEYLKGSTRLSDTGGYNVLEPGETNASLASACLRYLSSVSFDEPKNHVVGGHSLPPGAAVQLKLKHPFLDYAATHWPTHVVRSEPDGQRLTAPNDLIARFFDDTTRMKAWLRMTWGGDFEDVTALHVAARFGMLSFVRELLRLSRFKVDSLDSRGRTPLWYAAGEGHATVVRLLIEAGADPDKDETSRGLKPLHEAAQYNRHEVVVALLEAGVDPLTKKTRESPGRRCGNAPTSRGHTPLMYACHAGHLESVTAFLAFIKSPDVVARGLMWAVTRGRTALVKRFLEHPGIDVNAKVRGETHLHVACQLGHAKIIECLLRAGADPMVSSRGLGDEFHMHRRRYLELNSSEDDSKDNPNALHAFCSRQNHHGAKGHGYEHPLEPEQERAILQLLVDYGSDIHHRSSSRDIVLHVAVSTENLVLARLLVEMGSDIHYRNSSGRTALHLAASKGNVDLARLLIEMGAECDTPDSGGSSPLHAAVSVDMIDLLLEKGADINRRTNSGITPLSCSVSRHESEPLRLLERGADPNICDNNGQSPLHFAVTAAAFGPTERGIVGALLKAGARPNHKDTNGETPILRLGRNRVCHRIETLEALHQAGADFNARDAEGRTLLFSVVRAEETFVPRPGREEHSDIKSITTRGGLITIRDFRGRSLLHEVITSRREPIRFPSHLAEKSSSRFEYLLSAGLDPKCVDHDGNTLLHMLAQNRECRSIRRSWEELIDLGVDPMTQNHSGRTALHAVTAHDSTLDDPNVLALRIALDVTSNIDITDRRGMTPLHIASKTSQTAVQMLLEAGANPLAVTKQGLTPLHLAVSCCQVNIAGMLIDALRSRHNGPGEVEGINLQDESGQTALLLACKSGRPESVALLLKSGGDVTVKGRYKSMFHVLADFEDERIISTVEGALSAVDGDVTQLRNPDMTQMRRPGLRGYHSRAVLNNGDTSRLEEIVIMLEEAGATPPKGPIYPVRTSPLSIRSHGDYTASCLRRIGGQEQEPGEFYLCRSKVPGFDKHAEYFRVNAALDALQSYQGLCRGERNEALFFSMLLNREYDQVIEVCRLGADFVDRDINCSSKLAVLVSGGFYTLLDKVGQIEKERKFLEGSYHAWGDSTKPGLGVCRRHGPYQQWDYANKPDPLLIIAVKRELPNLEVLRVLVEKLGFGVNEPVIGYDYQRMEVCPMTTPLMELARGKHWWQASQGSPYLIQQGADLEFRDGQGRTPLHISLGGAGERRSCGIHHKDAVRALIRAGADVNAVDADGVGCLSYAGQDMDMIELLVRSGIRVGAEALFTAIDALNPDLLRSYLSAGVDPNIRRPNTSGETTTEAKKQRMRAKMKWGGFPCSDDGMDKHQWYPLHWALTHHKFETSVQYHDGFDSEDTKSKLKTRREKWAKVNAMVQALLEHGADPFATFLKRAKTKKMDDLLEISIDVEGNEVEDRRLGLNDQQSRPSRGYWPCMIFHTLLTEGHFTPALLSVPGLDPNTRDATGRTLLHAACASRHGPDAPIDIGQYILLEDRTWRNIDVPLSEPDHSAPRSILEHLLSLGADPLAVDDGGWNVLHHMLGHDCQTVMRSLTSLASKHPMLLAQKDTGGKGYTPLLVACVRAVEVGTPDLLRDQISEDLIDALLEAGADPTVADNDGNTALHILAPRIRISHPVRSLFMKMLDMTFIASGETTRRKLDINARNTSGETPLFAAYGPPPTHHWDGTPKQHYRSSWPYGDSQAALALKTELDAGERHARALLVAAGADYKARDNRGRTLLHVIAAREEGRAKTCHYGTLATESEFKAVMAMGVDPLVEDIARDGEDGGGRTALDVAAAVGNTAILNLFESS